MENGPKDHTNRLATASKMRKLIEDTFKKMSDANDELAKLLEDDKKMELADEVRREAKNCVNGIIKSKTILK